MCTFQKYNQLQKNISAKIFFHPLKKSSIKKKYQLYIFDHENVENVHQIYTISMISNRFVLKMISSYINFQLKIISSYNNFSIFFWLAPDWDPQKN